MVRYAFLALAGLIGLATATPGQAQEKIVTAQATENLMYMPVYVARAKKLFEDEGLTVEQSVFKAGPQAVAALLADEANIYLGPPGTAAKVISKGQDIKVFGTIVSEIPVAIVLRGDVAEKLGITQSMPVQAKLESLRGLTLGHNGAGGGPDLVLRYALRTAGLDPERDLTISPVGTPAAVLASLEQRRVDGIVLSTPVPEIAEKKFGAKILLHLGRGEYPPLKGFIYVSMVAKSEWLRAKPDRAEKVVRAIWRAQKLIAEKPSEARQLVRPFFKSMDEDTFDAGFNLYLGALAKTPRVEESGVRKNLDFLVVAERLKLDLEPSQIFTNGIVDRAAASMK